MRNSRTIPWVGMWESVPALLALTVDQFVATNTESMIVMYLGLRDLVKSVSQLNSAIHGHLRHI